MPESVAHMARPKKHRANASAKVACKHVSRRICCNTDAETTLATLIVKQQWKQLQLQPEKNNMWHFATKWKIPSRTSTDNTTLTAHCRCTQWTTLQNANNCNETQIQRHPNRRLDTNTLTQSADTLVYTKTSTLFVCWSCCERVMISWQWCFPCKAACCIIGQTVKSDKFQLIPGGAVVGSKFEPATAPSYREADDTFYQKLKALTASILASPYGFGSGKLLLLRFRQALTA